MSPSSGIVIIGVRGLRFPVAERRTGRDVLLIVNRSGVSGSVRRMMAPPRPATHISEPRGKRGLRTFPVILASLPASPLSPVKDRASSPAAIACSRRMPNSEQVRLDGTSTSSQLRRRRCRSINPFARPQTQFRVIETDAYRLS